MASVTLHHGDNRDHLRRLVDQGVRVHSAVMDPPYGLTSITKRFGKEGAAPAKFGSDGAFARASAGFMGSRWDGTGIERDPEFWKLVYDILLPGGYVVAFSGARTGHWQACAMEMAGFIMHPMLGWVTGQGFPKAHSAMKQIDKTLGKTGSVVPQGEPVKRMIPGADQHKHGWEKNNGREYQPGQYVPATDEAAQWEGWAYGAQALKPALEPIYVGQKPFSEKNGALNLLKHGVGAINIDGCRVPGMPEPTRFKPAQHGQMEGWRMSATGEQTAAVAAARGGGRHPGNLLHDGSDDVVALFPESGGSGRARTLKRGQKDREDGWGMDTGNDSSAELRDAGSGSAARFFNAFPMTEDDYAELQAAGIICDLSTGTPIFYQGKAAKADRAGSKHPTVKPIALMSWLCRLVTPPGGTVLDPFAGSGTTGAAALAEGFDCILMEAEAQFAADIRRRFNLDTPDDSFDSLIDADDLESLLC